MVEGNPIVVVGASLAGLRAVEALRKRGVDRSIVWLSAENAGRSAFTKKRAVRTVASG